MPARLLAAALLVIFAQSGQQQPAFRSGTEIILVDVQVSDNKWRPLEGLSKDQFEVSVDGRRRTIVNSEFVRVGTGVAPTLASLSAPPPAPAETQADMVPPAVGRTLILGVDQSSIQIVNEPAVTEAVTRLLDFAAPEDLIGLVAYPQPGVSVAPTHDRAAVREALKKVGGQSLPTLTPFNISIAEAVDFAANDEEVKVRVTKRECRGGDAACRRQLEDTARQIMVETEIQALRSINGLQSLVEAVREWPGRKTLVVISAGIITTDRIGGRPDVALEADTLGRRAAEANAVIYTLHLDVAFLTQFSAKNKGRVQTVHRDGGLAANGLERFTGNAGGSLITVHAGPDQALRRLLQETSAYYLLAVETMPEDRDGKVHRIQVRVKQRGATVRSRTAVFIPKAQ